jgi:hypothetical protein
MTNIENCGRCGSKIVEQSWENEYIRQFHRKTDSKTTESRSIRLCSECVDEIWEFVFEEDIDRSDKADSISLQRLSRDVQRHIDDLEGVLEELEEEYDS